MRLFRHRKGCSKLKKGDRKRNRKLAEVSPPGLKLAENGMIVLPDFRYNGEDELDIIGRMSRGQRRDEEDKKDEEELRRWMKRG